jgi:hypothetical protein
LNVFLLLQEKSESSHLVKNCHPWKMINVVIKVGLNIGLPYRQIGLKRQPRAILGLHDTDGQSS